MLTLLTKYLLMNEPIAPIPTEFKGVRFRSKSEAQFAWSLNRVGILWEYEPIYLTCSDTWIPDFFVAFTGKDHSFTMAVVEYKPKPVTDSYRAQLENRFAKLKEKITLPIYCCLAVGNAYDHLGSVEVFRPGVGWERNQDAANLMFQFIGESRNYRFEFQDSPDD